MKKQRVLSVRSVSRLGSSAFCNGVYADPVRATSFCGIRYAI